MKALSIPFDVIALQYGAALPGGYEHAAHVVDDTRVFEYVSGGANSKGYESVS